MEFVTRLKAGERMTDLCREFGISRKTGYKFEQRYEKHGPLGLYDVSRRPRRLARQVSSGIQTAILDWKRDQPTWGAEQWVGRNVQSSLFYSEQWVGRNVQSSLFYCHCKDRKFKSYRFSTGISLLQISTSA
jgi:hypothetical protein